MTLRVDRVLCYCKQKHFENHIIEEGFFGQEINHTTYNLANEHVFTQYQLRQV